MTSARTILGVTLVLSNGLYGCGAADTPRPCPPAAATPPATAAPAAASVPASAAPAQAFGDARLTPVFTDPERRKKIEATFPGLEALIDAERKKQKAPSMVVGVVVDGELVYSRGSGTTDPAGGKVPDVDTVYRIGSISKSFVGLAALSLRDDGALGLDDSLVQWVPEAAGLVYPTRDAAPITLRQLATHRSGLPRTATIQPESAPTEADVLKALKGLPLESPPGVVHRYSNLGFGLLGIAAGRAAKMPVRDLVTKRLFAPLGMTSSGWDDATVPEGRLATPYERGPDGEPKKTTPLKLGALEGSGGIFSSLRDMARYLAFQLDAYPARDTPDKGPVRRSTVREAHSTGTRSWVSVALANAPKKGEPAVSLSSETYGFGWASETTCEYDDIVWHNGAIDGFTAAMTFLPSRGVGVVVLASYFGADPSQVAGKVLRAIAAGGGMSARALPASPELEAAMKRLLAVQNTWDEAAYKAMLTAGRKEYPEEKEELAGYRNLHGKCNNFAPLEVESPLRGRFTVTCERGRFEMALTVSSNDAGISGFTGKSFDVDAPKALRRAADDLASLVGKWDERIYKKRIAPKATKPRDETFEWFETSLRKPFGACKVKSAIHEGHDTRFILACERGRDITLSVSLDEKNPDVVTGYGFRPVKSGTCPVH